MEPITNHKPQVYAKRKDLHKIKKKTTCYKQFFF